MIRIFLGNVGSGKSACAVRDIMINATGRKTYTNIIAKGKNKNMVHINKDMIMKKEIVGVKKKRDGTEENIYKYEVNKDFWLNQKDPINICIDEAHSVFSSRSSFSTQNKIMSNFLALIRKFLKQNDSGSGDITFITQLPRRLDVIARDMCNHVRFHKMHYLKTCKKCGWTYAFTSNDPEELHRCGGCGKFALKKHRFVVEVWKYRNMDAYEYGEFYDHYLIHDIETTAFPFYDTMQWDDLF